MSGSRWVITPSWLSWSWSSFLYSSAVYSCHLFLISSASVRSIPFLSLIEPIFAWNVPLISLIFLKRSLVFPVLLFSSISLHWSLRKAFLSLLAILWNSAFRCLYLSFSPLLFASLLFTAICKASPDSHVKWYIKRIDWEGGKVNWRLGEGEKVSGRDARIPISILSPMTGAMLGYLSSITYHFIIDQFYEENQKLWQANSRYNWCTSCCCFFQVIRGVGGGGRSQMLQNNLNDFLYSSTYPGFLLVCSKFYDVCYYV